MARIKLRVKKTGKGDNITLPRYMSEHASGMDLFANLDEEVALNPGDRRLIPTGIAVAIPENYEGQIRPRSGLAIKDGVGIVNSPGTIDSDYRGEIKVILINLGNEPFVVKGGTRIAQLVITPVVRADLEEVEDLPQTVRNESGFGHTGSL
ncbi:MAG: dUTP diphosphatase [Proteobacteria bacterium]|nr:dUTP diphosphatase [Pseudomonadota bacterium]